MKKSVLVTSVLVVLAVVFMLNYEGSLTGRVVNEESPELNLRYQAVLDCISEGRPAASCRDQTAMSLGDFRDMLTIARGGQVARAPIPFELPQMGRFQGDGSGLQGEVNGRPIGAPYEVEMPGPDEEQRSVAEMMRPVRVPENIGQPDGDEDDGPRHIRPLNASQINMGTLRSAFRK